MTDKHLEKLIKELKGKSKKPDPKEVFKKSISKEDKPKKELNKSEQEKPALNKEEEKKKSFWDLRNLLHPQKKEPKKEIKEPDNQIPKKEPQTPESKQLHQTHSDKSLASTKEKPLKKEQPTTFSSSAQNKAPAKTTSSQKTEEEKKLEKEFDLGLDDLIKEEQKKEIEREKKIFKEQMSTPLTKELLKHKGEFGLKKDIDLTIAPRTKDQREKSSIDLELEKAQDKIIIETKEDVEIYKIPGKPLLYYHIPATRPTPQERLIINTIKEVATRIISFSPYKIRDPEQRRHIYKYKILDIIRSSPELKIPESRIDFYAEAVVREMVGYGIIDPFLKDDNLEEIMVIGPKKPVYLFHRKYEMMLSNVEFYSDQEIQDLINKIAREVGRRVDLSSPLLDARLQDGSRVNATIPPISVSGSSLTIRKFRKDPYSVVDLINLGTMDSRLAAFLWLAVDGLKAKPANILISGGTGSGKTTTLNVLVSYISPRERIITIEDTAELNLPLEHWIRLESRPPGLEGTGEITLDILTKNSLRMRPDRIIVGEIRHDEAFSLFTAMNTGHAGSMGTVHANSSQETLIRVTNPPMNVPETMLSGLDFILVQNRIHDPKKGTIRRITELSEVTGVLAGKPQTQTLFEWDPVTDSFKQTEVVSEYVKELTKYTGLTKLEIDHELEVRADFIESLRKENIRDQKEVSKRMLDFLLEREKHAE